MSDINLHKAAESDIRISRQKSIIKSGPFISLTILIVVMVAFGITFASKEASKNKQEELQNKRNALLNSLDQVAMSDAVDFQYSVDNIAFNIENKKNPQDILQKAIEERLVKGSYLKSLVYDSVENKLITEVASDSFRSAASQILSLKNSTLFADIRVAESGRNQQGEAVFVLEGIYLQ
ncbi:MAG: hypothetical protein EOM84_02390 [Sphingobacteriia bacterium]|nr:hypothetical protein [Sphingobacteriia bacterium]